MEGSQYMWKIKLFTYVDKFANPKLLGPLDMPFNMHGINGYLISNVLVDGCQNLIDILLYFHMVHVVYVEVIPWVTCVCQLQKILIPSNIF